MPDTVTAFGRPMPPCPKPFVLREGNGTTVRLEVRNETGETVEHAVALSVSAAIDLAGHLMLTASHVATRDAGR